jgi:hypothetical protein
MEKERYLEMLRQHRQDSAATRRAASVEKKSGLYVESFVSLYFLFH